LPPTGFKNLIKEKLTVDWSQYAKSSAVFFIPIFKKEEFTMSKNLEQLRAETEQAETKLVQEKHKLERLENRKKYLEKGERSKRTHRLCNLGGTIESLAPEVKELTRTEMIELMEYIFSLAKVRQAVQHMAVNHANTITKEKERKDDGTVSSERNPD
jgi:hypothetical protein